MTKGKKSPTKKKSPVNLPAVEEAEKVLKKTPSKLPIASKSQTTGMKAKMAKVGVPARCAVTGYGDMGGVEAAHLYPDCWIKDGTYKLTKKQIEHKSKKNEEERKKNPLKDIPRLKLNPLMSLEDYVPAAGRKRLLESPANRIFLNKIVHGFFDGKAQGAAKLGRWALCPKTNKKKEVVPHQYVIIVKEDHREDMKKIGVTHRNVVQLPHVDGRLVHWHLSQFLQFLPTAGADAFSPDDVIGDDEDDSDVEEALVQEADDRCQQYVREQAAAVSNEE